MALRQGSRGDVPRLHGLSQVPQHHARRRPGQARRAGQGRGQVREVRRPDGRQARPPRRVPRLPELSQVPQHRARSPTSSRSSSASRPRPPPAPSAADLKAIAGRGDLRELRRPDDRPRRAAAASSSAAPTTPSARGPASPARRPSRRSRPSTGGVSRHAIGRSLRRSLRAPSAVSRTGKHADPRSGVAVNDHPELARG